MIFRLSRLSITNGIIGVAALMLFSIISPLFAADNNSAYSLTVTVGDMRRKAEARTETIDLYFTLTTTDANKFALPKLIDRIHLKFRGTMGGIADNIIVRDIKLGGAKKTKSAKVSWTVQVPSNDEFGSVEAKAAFTIGDDDVHVEADSFIGGFSLVATFGLGREPGIMGAKLALTTTLTTKKPIVDSIDKVKVTIYDRAGEKISTEIVKDIDLIWNMKLKTGYGYYEVAGNYKSIGSFEVTAYISPEKRTITVSDEGCLYKCAEEERLEEAVERVNKSIADLQPAALPALASLGAHPNPFNPSTNLRFELPESQVVSLNVYDMLGRHVVELVSGQAFAGTNNVRWDGADKLGHLVPSGIYIARLATPDYTQAMRLVLLK